MASTTKVAAFFQKFQNTVCALKVTETRPTSACVFILGIFALEGERESKYDEKHYFGAARRVLICLSSLSL